MYSISDLDAEIAQEAESMVNGETPKNWLIQAVLKKHQRIEGPDAEMAFACMRETVANRVNKYFSALKANQINDPQLPLPGFKRLQQRYVITRRGQQAIVAIHNMTDAEIEAKAIEMDMMAEGCREHARELRRYIRRRRAGMSTV